MTTDREAELARRREYENRRQMVEKAARVMWEAAWPNTPWDGASEDDRGPHLDDASDVLDAILPQVTTVAELQALPYRSVLVGTDGWVTRWMAGRDAEYILADAPTLPLTVVWQPEVTR